jgi:hypothetical protein
MLEALVLRNCHRALQAKIVGCKRDDRSAVVCSRGLRHDRGGVEYTTKDHLVMADGAIHDFLGLREELLYVLCMARVSGLSSPCSIPTVSYHSRTEVSPE